MGNPVFRRWTETEVSLMFVRSEIANRIRIITDEINTNATTITDAERRRVFDRVVDYYLVADNVQQVADQYARDVAVPGVLLAPGLGITERDRLANLIRQWYTLGLRDRNRDLIRDGIRNLLEVQGVEDAYVNALFALLGREPIANRDQLAGHLNVDVQDLTNRNATVIPEFLQRGIGTGIRGLHFRVRNSGDPFNRQLHRHK
jgi:hypothetical protein